MKRKAIIKRAPNKLARATHAPAPPGNLSFPVIAMATSAGGLKALSVILNGLPADFPAAIVVVMHLSPDHESLLAEILKYRTHLDVQQAQTGDTLSPSGVFVAPPNRHLSVARGGRLKLSSSSAAKVHHARPSAEPLFASVAAIYKTQAIAVVLTGGDGDGGFGVQIIKDNGGTVIAQDRPTSEDFSMPETSIKTGNVDVILPLDEIASKLIELVGAGSGQKNGRTTTLSRTNAVQAEGNKRRGAGNAERRRVFPLPDRSRNSVPEKSNSPPRLSAPSASLRLSGLKSTSLIRLKKKPSPAGEKLVTPHFSIGTKAAMIKRKN